MVFVVFFKKVWEVFFFNHKIETTVYAAVLLLTSVAYDEMTLLLV